MGGRGGFVAERAAVPVFTPSVRTGPDAGFLQAAGASARTSVDEQTIPQDVRLTNAYTPVVDALADMGVQRSTLTGFASGMRVYGGRAAAARPRVLDHDAVWRAIGAARARDPKAFAGLPADRATFEADVLGRHGERAKDQAVAARGGLVARLAGGAAAGFVDPVNLATMPLGGEGTTLLRTVLREAVLNAGVEVVQTPGTIAARARMGEATSASEVALDIASAGAFGGVLGGGIHLAKPLARAGAERVADTWEAGLAAAWPHMPEAVRQRWKSSLDVTDDDLPDLAEATIGAGNFSADEKAAVTGLRGRAAAAAASPFVPNGAGQAAHEAELGAALSRVLDNVPAARSPRAALRSATSLTPPAVRGGDFGHIVHIEGGTDPRTGAFLTSPKGAIGPAQVMPGTAPEAARLAGLAWDEHRYRTDAAYNLALGNAYFNEQRRIFGDPSMAAAAYNAGPGSARKGTGLRGAMRRAEQAGEPGNWRAYLPAETRAYVAHFEGRRGGGGSAGPTLRPEAVAGGDVAAAQARLDALRAQGAALTAASADAPEATIDPAPSFAGEVEGMTVASYVDRYLAGQGRDELPMQQFAANNADAIEMEFQQRARGGEPAQPQPTTRAERAEQIIALAKDGKSLAPARVARTLGVTEEDARSLLFLAASKPHSGLITTGTGRVIRRPVARSADDAMTLIARHGGLRNDEGHDLRGAFGPVMTAAGPLIRRKGMSVDAAGDLLHQFNYLTGDTWTESDVLDLVDRHARGERHFAYDSDGDDMRERLGQAKRQAEDDALVDQVRGAFEDVGIGAGTLDDGLIHDAALLTVAGHDVNDAVSIVVHQRARSLLDTLDAEAEDGRYDRYAALEDDAAGGAGGDGVAGASDAGWGIEPGDPGRSGADAFADEGRTLDDLDAAPLTQAAMAAFDDPDAAGAKAQVDSLDHDLRAAIDPNIAERQRQEAALGAVSPMRAKADQDSTIGAPLFDAVDQFGLRLDEDGDVVNPADLLAQLDAEQSDIDNLRGCL